METIQVIFASVFPVACECFNIKWSLTFKISCKICFVQDIFFAFFLDVQLGLLVNVSVLH